MSSANADIAVMGLAVMGQNLILNMADHGVRVIAYNRTASKVDEFLAGPAKGTTIQGAHSVAELAGMLQRPRRVMLMVKAGAAVDEAIATLVPHMEAGDIIIDGGNSLFVDTERRVKFLAEKGIHFLGTGISGGEEGARHGPSIMPGGASLAWPHVKDIFQRIAAKTDAGEACCDWVGEGGAGHFTKMVHNGIEYGDMQLIAESYHLLSAAGYGANDMAKVFSQWNQGNLASYLIEITAAILAVNEADGTPLVERILDAAGQKGTGRWTSESALQLGVPLTLITESVYARALSAMHAERQVASRVLPGPKPQKPVDGSFVRNVQDALLAAKLVSYAQGFMLLSAAGKENAWQLNLGGIALLWRGGCIIRSSFLGKIKEAYTNNPALANLMLDPWFENVLAECQQGWRATVAWAAMNGIPVPGLAAALSFYDGYRSARLPANLTQAQRDYFGAHTFERTDKPRGEFFHHDWIGSGGFASSGAYTA